MKPVHFSTGQWLVPQGSCYVHLDLLLWEPAGVCTNTLKTLKPDPLATRCQALSDFDWLTLPLSFPALLGSGAVFIDSPFSRRTKGSFVTGPSRC